MFPAARRGVQAQTPASALTAVLDHQAWADAYGAIVSLMLRPAEATAE